MHDSTYLYQNSDNTTSLYETSNDATIILEQGSRGLTGPMGATGATGAVGSSSNQMSALKRWHQQFGKAREGLVTGGASKYVTDVLWVGDSIGEGYNSNVSNTTMVNVFTDNISKLANINGRSGRWVPAGGDWLTSPKFSDQDSSMFVSHTITAGAFPGNEVFLSETYATSIFPTAGNASIYQLYGGLASISYTGKRNNGGKTVLTGVTIIFSAFLVPSVPTFPVGTTVYFGGDDTLARGFSLRSRSLLPIAGQNIGDTATLEFTGDNVIVYYRKVKFLTGSIQFSLELKDSSGVYQPFYTSSSIYTYKTIGASYEQELFAWNAATAYGSSMPRGDYRLKVYNYVSSIFTVSGTSVAAAATYTGVTQSATSGIGSGAVFTITKTGSGTTYTSSNTTVTVTTNGVGYQSGDTITIPGASLGGATPTNNLTLTCAANYSVSFDGAYVCDGNTDQGVRVWNSSKYGTNFSSFNSNVDTTLNADWLSALRNALVNPSLVVIALGTNESANPTTIESGLTTMVDSIKAAYAVGYPGSPYPSFAFFVPPADSNTISSEWVVIRDTYATVASSLGAALWNWAEFTGDVNSEIGDPYGWTTDTIHPSVAGHRAIGDFVTSQALLSINAINSSIPNIPSNYDFNITTGNINASLLTSGTVNNNRLPSAATTITSVGTLSSLAVTGGVTAGSFTGPLTGNASTVTTNANLTGDVTSVGNATTLTNAPVIAKVLTGYVLGTGTVAATDSILQAFQKKADLASPTFTGTPTLPTGTTATTQTAGNSTTAVATTAFVTTANQLMGTYTSYTPTFTNVTAGNGTSTGAYCRVNNFVHYYGSFTLGTTSSVTAGILINLPININADMATVSQVFGMMEFHDVSAVTTYGGQARYVASASSLTVSVLNAAGAYLQVQNANATVPFTWTTGDIINFNLYYRAV